MAFTFVVWAFGLIFLIAAILCYITFLVHWIPKSDGGLRGYCERKISQALKKIVTKKVNRALAKGQQKQMEADMKAAAKNGGPPPLERMATLPTLPNITPMPTQSPAPQEKGDSLPQMPMLNRVETGSSLPPYTSRPSSPGGIEMNKMGRRPMPSRTGTMASTTTDRSYSSKASLLGSAADMGHGRPASPVPSVPDINLANMPPSGPGTPASARTFGAHPGMGHGPSSSNGSTRMMPAGSPAPSRSGPNNRPTDPYSQPMDSYENARRHSPPQRQYNAYDPSRASPAPSSNYQRSTPGPYDAPSEARGSPAPSVSTYRGGPPAMQSNAHPMRSATGPVPPRGPYQPPQRNMTAPMPPRGPGQDPYDRSLTPQGMRPPQTPQGFDRSGTPQSQRGSPYGYDVESQRNNGYGY